MSAEDIKLKLVEAEEPDENDYRLQEQVGFKLGRWRDVGWWQLRLAPASNPPPALK